MSSRFPGRAIAYELLCEEILCFAYLALGPGSRSARERALAALARDTRIACPGRATPDLIRGERRSGTQGLALDSRLRGNERSLLLTPFVPAFGFPCEILLGMNVIR